MLIKTINEQFIKELTPIYDAQESQSLFLLCLEELENKKRLDLVLNPELSTQKQEKWQQVLKDLKQAKPIQYIFNTAYFYDLIFKVTPDTLIPRSETEELVEWILDSLEDKNKAISILDIGTGSGCIGITLAKNLPNAKVTLMDVSPNALEVALYNAKANDVKVNTIEQDVLALEQLKDTYDIIVSNPPYVRELEKVEIHSNVLDNEPHLALFVSDNDPLIFYRKIVHLATANLPKGGMLFFEINQYLGQGTLDLFNQLDFNQPILRKDLKQNDRMIKAVKL
ncbi:peptide chain release factor N(5)-glutamine methyltransferase [Myroides sp. LJL115]